MERPMDTAWEDVCLKALHRDEWKKWAARCTSHWMDLVWGNCCNAGRVSSHMVYRIKKNCQWKTNISQINKTIHLNAIKKDCSTADIISNLRSCVIPTQDGTRYLQKILNSHRNMEWNECTYTVPMALSITYVLCTDAERKFQCLRAADSLTLNQTGQKWALLLLHVSMLKHLLHAKYNAEYKPSLATSDWPTKVTS